MKYLGVRGIAAALATVGAMQVLEGCTDNLRVLATSRLVLSTAARQAEPEVTETATIRGQRGRVQYVALQAPDYCISESVAQTTGQSENATGDSGNEARVLETFCGVQMGEIERALSNAGYIVANWRALRTYAGGDNHQSPIQYARRIGAQVLLQVNSLERVEARASRDGRWERRYEEANTQGNATGELPLRSADRRAVRELLSTQEDLALGSTPLGITLDVNAVLVANGQTVWFYRWTKVAEDQRQRQVRLLAHRIAPGVWQSLAFAGADEEDQAISSEMEALSASQRNANRDRAQFFRQTREVVNDFTQRFVQAVGVSASSGGGLQVPDSAASGGVSADPAQAPTAAAAPQPAAPPTIDSVPVPAPASSAPGDDNRRRHHRRGE